MSSGYQRGKNPASHGSRDSSTYSPVTVHTGARNSEDYYEAHCKTCGSLGKYKSESDALDAKDRHSKEHAMKKGVPWADSVYSKREE